MNRAVFLDRDGTINVEIEYLHEPAKFRFEYQVPHALKLLQDAGFKLIITTNQGAIGKGLYTLKDMQDTHAFMIQELGKFGVRLDGIYFCPHPKDARCRCRKPEPGMILDGIRDHGIDPNHSWMVGDKLKDIEAGNRAQLRTILVMTGYGRQEKEQLELMEKCAREPLRPTFFAPHLYDAAQIILKETGK